MKIFQDRHLRFANGIVVNINIYGVTVYGTICVL